LQRTHLAYSSGFWCRVEFALIQSVRRSQSSALIAGTLTINLQPLTADASQIQLALGFRWLFSSSLQPKEPRSPRGLSEETSWVFLKGRCFPDVQKVKSWWHSEASSREIMRESIEMQLQRMKVCLCSQAFWMNSHDFVLTVLWRGCSLSRSGDR
jgi:hypothetical protein